MTSLLLSKKLVSKKLLSLSIAASLLTTILLPKTVLADTLSSTQQKQLTEISAMLVANPNIIEGLHSNLSEHINGQQNINSTLEQNYDYLYNNPQHPYLGAENPKLTIINFTDYNCPFCKRLETGLMEVIKNHPEVRVVNVYLPFQQRLVPGTQTNTAWYALDVWENNRANYAEVHRLMMAKPSRHDKDSIMKIAKMTNSQGSLLVNEQKKALVERNEQVFANLGLRGTPSLIIGDDIIPGFIPQQQLESLVKAQLKK